MKNHKMVEHKSTVVSALDDVKSEVEMLRDEIEEWKSNLEGTGLENTGKYCELEEAFDSLDAASQAFDSIELDEELGDKVIMETEITYIEFRPYGKRGASRPTRCSNACSMVNAIKEAIEGRIDFLEEKITITDGDTEKLDDELNGVENTNAELQDVLDNLESVNFPGMY